MYLFIWTPWWTSTMRSRSSTSRWWSIFFFGMWYIISTLRKKVEMMYHMTKKNIGQHLDVLHLDLIVDVHHGVHIKKIILFMKDKHSIVIYWICIYEGAIITDALTRYITAIYTSQVMYTTYCMCFHNIPTHK